MKRLLYAIASMLILVMGLNSCTGEAVDVEQVNKQTILVFLPWSGGNSSNGLTYYLSNNLDSISQGIIDKKGLNNTRVMVFFSESADKSTLYDLEYDAVNRNVNRIPIKTYNGATYNSAEGFADVLNTVKTNAEALNYALIIGGHGCGWTFADNWLDYPNYAKPHFEDWNSNHSQYEITAEGYSGIQFGNDPNLPITRFFGSVSKKDNSIDVTTLAEGIRQSGIKMQYILFDACYMGNVETAYELKEVTNYLISSSSEILAMGIPYRTLWSSLNSVTPNYSSIVSSTISFYKNNNMPWINMAAIDCRQMDGLASIMKEINSKYKLDSTVPLDSIQPLDGFTPNLMYDLKVYIDSLCPTGYLKEQFSNQLKKTIKAEAHTEQVVSSLSGSVNRYYDIKSYCGLSISDPSLHEVAIRGREKTGWWKATH